MLIESFVLHCSEDRMKATLEAVAAGQSMSEVARESWIPSMTVSAVKWFCAEAIPLVLKKKATLDSLWNNMLNFIMEKPGRMCYSAGAKYFGVVWPLPKAVYRGM